MSVSTLASRFSPRTLRWALIGSLGALVFSLKRLVAIVVTVVWAHVLSDTSGFSWPGAFQKCIFCVAVVLDKGLDKGRFSSRL